MNCKLVGSFIQYIEVTLAPAERFYAERGALIYMDAGIEPESTLNGRGLGGLIGAHISGESIISVSYVNRTNHPLRLVVGGSSSLIPVKLDGMELVCRRGAYVAASQEVEISSRLSVRGLVGGMGLFLQSIRGNATVFLDSIGQPVVLDLAAGQRIEIDENHIVALHGIPSERMSSRWSLKNMFQGEGLSLLTAEGPGRVYISPGRFAIR